MVDGTKKEEIKKEKKKVEEVIETKEETKKEPVKVKEETKKVKEVIITSGYVVSRLNHPVMIHYGKDALMLPPRGKSFFKDLSKVRNLPITGCYKVFNKKNK